MNRPNFYDIWKAGQPIRKHTMKTDRRETIAEHTWGAVALLMCAWPNAPIHIVYVTQFHDFGEDASGDMSARFRWANPAVNDALEDYETNERSTRLPKYVFDYFLEMRPDEYKIVDFFDRADFCYSQIKDYKMGNTYARDPFERAHSRMQKLLAELSPILRDFGDEDVRQLWLNMGFIWTALQNEMREPVDPTTVLLGGQS